MENGEELLDVEGLEKICFERSKKWANLIEHISLRDEGEELDINEFNVIFEKNDEDDNDVGSDDAFIVNDEELEETINYNTDLHKTRVEGNQKPKHKYDLLLVKTDGNHKDEDHNKTEMENIVDETLPLLIEHKRKWEENGLERVLQSFDVDKIERKVGSWLRRNNSVFSQNNKTVRYHEPSHNHSKQSTTSRMPQHSKYKHHHHKKDEDTPTYSSDAESMHSVDTARYIKSSRRHVEPQSGFSTFCTKTTIKTFRMVKSKRDELREKYGSPEYDEEHSHRIQKMRHRRQQNHHQHDYSVALCQRKHRMDGHHMSSQRRKHLIKRRSNLEMIVSSSEDDECEDCTAVYNRTNRPMIKSPRRCPSVQRHTRHRCDHHLDRTPSSCGCSSKHNDRQNVERSKLMNMKYEERDPYFESDRRPYRRETECSCCNETKLCKTVRHLANSSTEDWLVENGDSGDPSETKKVSTKLDHRKALKEKEKLNIKAKKREADDDGSGNRHVTLIPETKQSAIKTKSSRESPKSSGSLRERQSSKNSPKTSRSRHESHSSKNSPKTARSLRERKSRKNSPKTARSLREKKSSTIYVLDSSSDSNDSYRPVKKKTIMKATTQNEKVKSKKINSPPASSESKTKSARKQPTSLDKTKEKQKMIPDKVAMQQKLNKKLTNDENNVNLENNATTINDAGDTFRNDLHNAIKLSKMTYQEEMKRLAKEEEPKESCKKPKKQKDISEKSLTMIEATITINGENTFFSSSHNICNSTELNNNDKKNELKHITKKHESAVSTTHHQGSEGGGNSSNSSSAFGSNTISSKPKAAKRTMTMKHSKTMRKIIELDDNDCTIVSSTTDADAAPQQMQRNETIKHVPQTPKTVAKLLPSSTDKGILLYAPNARDIVPSNSFHDGYFTITEEHLSGIIGKKAAQKFLKYYIGRRRFRPNSTIYYKPPPNNMAYRAAECSTTLGGEPSQVSQYDDSDSDDDIFAKIGRYGHIHESFEK